MSVTSLRQGNVQLPLLIKHLQQVENHRDLQFTRTCVFDVLQLSSTGYDISPALPCIVKLLAHTDVFIKRVAGELVASHSHHNPEVVLLAVNTLVQDCKDLNPVVRRVSLNTLASLADALPSMDILSSAVGQGLEDSSCGQVRQTAALASIKLHQLAPEAVTESGLWDRLYHHLSDQDSGTVAACLCALESIFSKEKGVVMSNKLACYLISALPSFTSPVQRLVIQFLLKHSPKKKSQVFEHLNHLDDFLTQSSSIVTTLCTLELFCSLTSDLPKVKSKAFAAAWASVKVLLARERTEETITAIVHYLSATYFPTNIISKDYKTFFCRNDDALFLIKKKSCLLSKMITVDNAEEILQEFLPVIKCLDEKSVHEVLFNISRQMDKNPETEQVLVNFFIQLLQSNNKLFLEVLLEILPTVDFCDEAQWQTLASCIESHYLDITSEPAQIALLHLIHRHSSYFSKAPDILQHVFSLTEEDDAQVQSTAALSHTVSKEDQRACVVSKELQLSLLSTMVQVALDKPARMQQMLAQLMEKCFLDEKKVVRDRALVLYHFLFSKTKKRLEVRLDS